MIQFRTNIDIVQSAVWALNNNTKAQGILFPTGTTPAKGSYIMFTDGNFKFELEVVQVTYDIWAERTIVELHIPSTFPLVQWEAWFKKHRN